MKNFGFTKLILVNPCELGDDGYARAMHAKDILEKSKTVNSFEQAIKNIDFVVGTSGIVNVNDKRHLRNPLPPSQFAKRIYEVEGNIGLVFGREDDGLHREELAKCDVLVTIPASQEYPIMNISHACSIILYELRMHQHSLKAPRETSKSEKERLYEQFKLLLDSINYPKHKRQKTEILFRRMMGRALPSKWEYHTMMGVFDKATSRINKGKKK